MNTMSLSPVKPPLNTGTHTVPAAATNLTKPAPPLPSSTGNFAPIGLIPDAAATAATTSPTKPIQTQPTTVAVTINAERSVDLCSKPLPTSNGTVFPVTEPTIVAPAGTLPVTNACPSGPPNGVENCEAAQNLTINNPPPPPPTTTFRTTDPAPSKPVDNVPKGVDTALKTTDSVSKSSNDEAKVETKKQITPQKMELSSGPVQQPDAKPSIQKEIAPKGKETIQNETAKKDGATVMSASSTTPTESIPNNVVVSPAKKESIVTPDAGKFDKKSEQTSTIVQPSTANEKESDTKAEEFAEKNSSTPKPVKRKAKEAPLTETIGEDSGDGRKSKRIRLPTQPYQSPIPELQLIAKLQTHVKTTPKNAAEKIIAFYKNEFLAVRNPEGSFYICQTFQNIYKNSTKIRIRWFTNLPQDVFTPDFYDTTEFDCILTNVTMNRLEKDQWKLPDHERTRIENILKRSLDVEKGVVEQPSVTEEHPDGLDLSLYKDEAQLAQLKKRKKKPASPKKSSPDQKKQTTKSSAAFKSDKSSTAAVSGTKKSARLLQSQSKTLVVDKMKTPDSAPKSKKDKKEKKNKKRNKTAKKTGTTLTAKHSDKSNSKAWEPSVKASNSSRVVLSLKKEDVAKSVSSADSMTTKTATKRTSSVSLKASSNPVQSLPPPTKRRKEEPKLVAPAVPAVPAASVTAVPNQSIAAERLGKVRNAGSAVTAKINSAAMRTTKDKGSKTTVTTTTANQRKK